MPNRRYELLPRHLQQGMERYIESGIETGSFLRAVLENDLERAFALGDQECRSDMERIVEFLRTEVPPDRGGSRLIVQTWIERCAEKMKAGGQS